MSAIFGILRFDGRAASQRDLERMGSVLAHRGPDGRRVRVDGVCGLGQCLMRVTVEDMLENQPLCDGAVVLVADLRLDNRSDLALQFGLSEETLRTTPDSALLMRAYLEWGEDCARHLLGDFAFSIWDGETRTLLLGRDHMGQRTLHYHMGDGFMAFATEIKALWALGDVPRALSPAQVGRHLMYEIAARGGETLFEGIFGVPGGSTKTVTAGGGATTRRYWKPAPLAIHENRNEAYYLATYRKLFAEAVDCRVRRLMKPPALLLSAGYDSTAIAGLAGPAMRTRGWKMTAVAWVLPEGAKLTDNRCWVESCRRDMPHLDVRYVERGEQSSVGAFERAAPMADRVPFALPELYEALFREAAQTGARLLMDGIGGDETINARGGGLPAWLLCRGRFREFSREWRGLRRRSDAPLWRDVAAQLALPLLPQSVRNRIRQWRRRGTEMGTDWLVARAYAETLMRDGVVDPDAMPERLMTTEREALRRTTLEWMSQTPSQRLGIEAAAHGLELTRPLLDKRLVEFGLAIPPPVQVRDGVNRQLARRALADIYPHEFQSRGNRMEPLEPDIAGAFYAALPQIEASLDAWRADDRARERVDIDRLAGIAREARDGRATPADMALALTVAGALRYFDWFEGRNRKGEER